MPRVSQRFETYNRVWKMHVGDPWLTFPVGAGLCCYPSGDVGWGQCGVPLLFPELPSVNPGVQRVSVPAPSPAHLTAQLIAPSPAMLMAKPNSVFWFSPIETSWTFNSKTLLLPRLPEGKCCTQPALLEQRLISSAVVLF